MSGISYGICLSLSDLHHFAEILNIPPQTAEYTCSSAHRTFSRINHVWPQNKSQKFKKNEIIIKHLFQLPHYETRTRLHEKNWEKQKHVEGNFSVIPTEISKCAFAEIKAKFYEKSSLQSD